MRTWVATVAACSAALLAAATASAARDPVLVRPDAPVVGKRATIEVTARSTRPLRLEVVSPTGVRRTVALHRFAPGRWRASFRFADDGQWLLRVLPVRLASSVWVQQPPSAVPPYRPSPRSTITGLAALGQGSLLYP